MHSKLIVLLLSAVAISAATYGFRPQIKDVVKTPEFNDIVNYLEYNLSPSDIHELLDIIPEAFGEISDNDEELGAQPRSVGSAIGNAFEHIPWGKITDAVKKMAKNNPKFTKVLNLVTDKKFQDLVKKAVNSHTLAEFVKGVAQHGFTWTEFLHLLLHALCSTATTIQHDKYTVGVCQVLQNL